MLEILRSLFIGFFAVTVLLPVIRFAMRRMSVSTKDNNPLTSDEVKYIQKQELKLTLLYYFFACVLAVFSAGSLALISSIIHASSKDFLYLLTPNFNALFALGLLFGLTLAVLPLKLVQQVILGHEHTLYKKYLSQTEGSRSMIIYRILFIVMLVISCILTWFALQWHVSIDAESVKVTNLLSEERNYKLSQINSIKYLGTEGEYLITFDDNTNINTSYLKPAQIEMIAFLSQESGKTVIR